MKKKPIVKIVLARRRGGELSDYERVDQDFSDEDKLRRQREEPESRTAQFVSRFEMSETTRKAHADHVWFGAHEFRFTKDWTLKDYDPNVVTVQCPHCNWPWNVSSYLVQLGNTQRKELVISIL